MKAFLRRSGRVGMCCLKMAERMSMPRSGCVPVFVTEGLYAASLSHLCGWRHGDTETLVRGNPDYTQARKSESRKNCVSYTLWYSVCGTHQVFGRQGTDKDACAGWGENYRIINGQQKNCCTCVILRKYSSFLFMETTGFEPVTPCMSSKYSNQLSYASLWLVLYHTGNKNAILFYKIFSSEGLFSTTIFLPLYHKNLSLAAASVFLSILYKFLFENSALLPLAKQYVFCYYTAPLRNSVENKESFHIVKIANDNTVSILYSDSYPSMQDKYLTMYKLPDGWIYISPPTGNTALVVNSASGMVSSLSIGNTKNFSVTRYALDTDTVTVSKENTKYTFDKELSDNYTRFYTLSDGKGGVYLDQDGKLHIFYTYRQFDFDDADGRDNAALLENTLKHYHAVFDGTELISSEELNIAGLTDDSSVRMTEAADGTDYLLVCHLNEASAKLDVYFASENGWALTQTKDLGEFAAVSFSISSPRTGSVQDNVIDCIVYANDNDVYYTSVTFE